MGSPFYVNSSGDPIVKKVGRKIKIILTMAHILYKNIFKRGMIYYILNFKHTLEVRKNEKV